MRMVGQLLLGALAFLRFAVAEFYPVHGNINATTDPSMKVREANHTVWFVNVGKEVIWNFYPNTVYAQPGDTVMFTFYSSWHSVIQAQYGLPCIPYNMIHPDTPTFYSGVKKVTEDTDGDYYYPVWNLTINDTQPMFYYCGAHDSCSYWGMVGAINPTESTPVSNQIGLARLQDFSRTPGEKAPTEEQFASAIALASSSAGVASSSATATITVTQITKSVGPPDYSTSGYPGGSDGGGESYPEHHGLSTGAVAGIAVGSAVVAVAAVCLLWLLLRTRSLKKKLDQQQAAQNRPDPVMQSPMAGYGQPWPPNQARQMSQQLPPYKTQDAGGDMYKPPDSEGYAVSEVPSRGMSPHHTVSPYNMQGQFVGFQPVDGLQHRSTTHSELSGTVGPMHELDAPHQDMYDQSRGYQ